VELGRVKRKHSSSHLFRYSLVDFEWHPKGGQFFCLRLVFKEKGALLDQPRSWGVVKEHSVSNFNYRILFCLRREGNLMVDERFLLGFNLEILFSWIQRVGGNWDGYWLTESLRHDGDGITGSIAY
jgi:hypothetical protein